MWRFSMLAHSAKIIPMPPDERRNGSTSESARENGGDDAGLAKLLEQEELWFSWVTVLHERLIKVNPEERVAAEGQKVLAVAKRRWLEAKEALAQHRAGN